MKDSSKPVGLTLTTTLGNARFRLLSLPNLSSSSIYILNRFFCATTTTWFCLMPSLGAAMSAVLISSSVSSS